MVLCSCYESLFPLSDLHFLTTDEFCVFLYLHCYFWVCIGTCSSFLYLGVFWLFNPFVMWCDFFFFFFFFNLNLKKKLYMLVRFFMNFFWWSLIPVLLATWHSLLPRAWGSLSRMMQTESSYFWHCHLGGSLIKPILYHILWVGGLVWFKPNLMIKEKFCFQPTSPQKTKEVSFWLVLNITFRWWGLIHFIVYFLLM